jgi:hypothetical protein
MLDLRPLRPRIKGKTKTGLLKLLRGAQLVSTSVDVLFQRNMAGILADVCFQMTLFKRVHYLLCSFATCHSSAVSTSICRDSAAPTVLGSIRLLLQSEHAAETILPSTTSVGMAFAFVI